MRCARQAHVPRRRRTPVGRAVERVGHRGLRAGFPQPEPAATSRAGRVLRGAGRCCSGSKPRRPGTAETHVGLDALNRVHEAEPVQRLVRSIIIAQGDYNGQVLSFATTICKPSACSCRSTCPTAWPSSRAGGRLVEGPSDLGGHYRRRAPLRSRPPDARAGARSARPTPVPSPPVALVVQKFGGTSVADPDRIREVADHVARTRRRGDDVGRGRQRHGQGDRRPAPPGRQVSDAAPGPGDGHAHHRRRAQGDGAAVHGAARRSACRPTRFTGSQAGFITDTTHTNAKILEVRADRVREALDAGRVPVVGGSQGVSTDRRRHVPRPRRLRHHRGRAGPRPRGRGVRALHRRVRRVHRRPPRRARGPRA